MVTLLEMRMGRIDPSSLLAIPPEVVDVVDVGVGADPITLFSLIMHPLPIITGPS